MHSDGANYANLKSTRSRQLTIKPIELKDANEFVAKHHRHHKPVVGHRFSIACYDGEKLVGVCIVGRPVARNAGSPLEVIEVTRLCTDGTSNACSKLYGAAARIAKEIGFRKIQTYILESEFGSSLAASGWDCDGEAGGGQWKHTDDDGRLWPTRRTDQPTCKKLRYSKIFRKQ